METTNKANFTKRNLASVAILNLVTLGIYSLYWFFTTKKELNKAGAKVPLLRYIFFPIANLYFYYGFSEAFAKYISTKKSGGDIFLWVFAPLYLGSLFDKYYYKYNLETKLAGFIDSLGPWLGNKWILILVFYMLLETIPMLILQNYINKKVA